MPMTVKYLINTWLQPAAVCGEAPKPFQRLSMDGTSVIALKRSANAMLPHDLAFHRKSLLFAMPESKLLVAVIMGSKSDWETMRNAVETLNQLGVPNEARVLSAHRTPDATAEFARGAADRGLRVIIAG
ncbi:MAG TPA: AIR carboxylase family protein, partial [Candidatus Udaeobacter sp.]